MKKKVVAIMMTAAMAASMMLAGCGNSDDNADTNNGSSAEATEAPEAEKEGGETAGAEGPIVVVSREDGSGTRGAFVELFGIDADGEDNTTEDAEITNSTAVMMTTSEPLLT